MNVLIAIVQAIKAAVAGGWTNPAPAPARVKLAGRNGYGEDKAPASRV